MKVHLVTNPSKKATGISNYADKLFVELINREDVKLISTHKFLKLTKLFLSTFFNAENALNSFPLYLNLPSNGIIHFTTQQLCIPLIYLRRNSIVTVHDIIPFATNTYNSFFEKILYKLAMKGLKNATHIIADSEHTKNDLINLLDISQNKITVVPLGIDPNEFKQILVPKDECTILYVGSEMPRKNLPILIKALASVKKELPSVKLVKVGLSQWNYAREQLKKLALKLNVHNSIVWRDYSNNLNEEYNQATVFVFPSIYEGFGFPVLEAMAAGTPVICSNKTSLPEVGGNAVIYFVSNRAEELAEKIIKVLKDKKLQYTLIKKGLARAKEFSWKKTAEMTVKVYEILNSRD